MPSCQTASPAWLHLTRRDCTGGARMRGQPALPSCLPDCQPGLAAWLHLTRRDACTGGHVCAVSPPCPCARLALKPPPVCRPGRAPRPASRLALPPPVCRPGRAPRPLCTPRIGAPSSVQAVWGRMARAGSQPIASSPRGASRACASRSSTARASPSRAAAARVSAAPPPRTPHPAKNRRGAQSTVPGEHPLPPCHLGLALCSPPASARPPQAWETWGAEKAEA